MSNDESILSQLAGKNINPKARIAFLLFRHDCFVRNECPECGGSLEKVSLESIDVLYVGRAAAFEAKACERCAYRAMYRLDYPVVD